MRFNPINTTQIFNVHFWGPLFAIVIIWSLVWKGIALWRAARNNQLGWFVALLLINTMGILEILYLLFFGRKNKT
jgi:methionyl-tRNA synthetase